LQDPQSTDTGAQEWLLKKEVPEKKPQKRNICKFNKVGEIYLEQVDL